VTAVVVGPADPVEAGICELFEDMLREEIETKPYLKEQTGNLKQTLIKEPNGRKRISR
jgi:hypothetical protein